MFLYNPNDFVEVYWSNSEYLQFASEVVDLGVQVGDLTKYNN